MTKQIEMVIDYINKTYLSSYLSFDFEDALRVLSEIKNLMKENDISLDNYAIKNLVQNKILGFLLEIVSDTMIEDEFIRTLLDSYLELKMGDNESKKTMGDLEQLYLRDIKGVPLLTFEEERRLATLIQNGSKEARDKLIEANLALVIAIAKKYQGVSMPFLDIVEEGNYGLMKAAEKFDLSKGCRFSTFATYYIEGYIKKSLSELNMIRIPNHKIFEYRAYQKAIDKLRQDLKREPTIQEIADYLDMPLSKVSQLANIKALTPISSSVLVGEEEDTELGDFLSAEEMGYERIFDASIDYQMIIDLLDLTDNQKYFFKRYFIDGMKRTEIAKELGCTRQYISIIEGIVLKKLKREKNKILDILGYYYGNKDKDESFKMTRGPVSIYTIVKERKEIVNYVIAKLISDYSRYAIFMRWGSDLDSPKRQAGFNKKINDYFIKVTLPDIRQKCLEVKEEIIRSNSDSFLFDIDLKTSLETSKAIPLEKKSHIKTLYEIVSEDKEIVDYIIVNYLDDYFKFIIYAGFGSDLENPQSNSDYTKLRKDDFNNLVLPKIRELIPFIRARIDNLNGDRSFLNVDVKESLEKMKTYNPKRKRRKKKMEVTEEENEVKKLVLEELNNPYYWSLKNEIATSRIINFLLEGPITSISDLEGFSEFLDIMIDDNKETLENKEAFMLLQGFIHNVIRKGNHEALDKQKTLVEN